MRVSAPRLDQFRQDAVPQRVEVLRLAKKIGFVRRHRFDYIVVQRASRRTPAALRIDRRASACRDRARAVPVAPRAGSCLSSARTIPDRVYTCCCRNIRLSGCRLAAWGIFIIASEWPPAIAPSGTTSSAVPGFDHRAGHSPHHAGCLVLGEHLRAACFETSAPPRAVPPHPGKDRGDHALRHKLPPSSRTERRPKDGTSSVGGLIEPGLDSAARNSRRVRWKSPGAT